MACNLGVGCDEAGVCFAQARGEPNRCGASHAERVGAYAPGTYECKCLSCGRTFEGDKRALHCFDCATSIAAGHQPNIPFASQEEADEWEASLAIADTSEAGR